MGWVESQRFGMIKTLRFLISSLFGLLLCSACNSSSRPVVLTSPTPTQPPENNKSLPTPVFPGKAIVYHDLQVMMSQAETTTSYITEYGSSREPPAGQKFLWVRVSLKNISQHEQGLPAVEHFSVLYGTTEFKATYGHRKGHADYTALKTTVYEGQEVDAWLRFDIPAIAELVDLWFAYLPESSQVSISFSPTAYPWGDHPIYLWTCTPQ